MSRRGYFALGGVVLSLTRQVLEAVGVPDSFELATQFARPGGHIANIGVHGKPVTLHLEELWIRNITITTGLVDTPPPRSSSSPKATRSMPASS